MFIITARLPKKRLLAASAALLCCCVAVLTGLLCAKGLNAVSASSPLGQGRRGLKTNEKRVAYLQGLGWEVSEEPIAVEELLVPQVFDESYTDYLALQTVQGFDLTQCQGKRVKRYTYQVLNHPTGEEGVQAALLIYRNHLVGGEVLSAQANGFIHTLAKPAGG